MNKFQKVLVLLTILMALGGAAYSQYSISSQVKSVQKNFSGTSAGASEAISNFRVQSVYDKNIYQQQVTALWATKDLLKAIADEQSQSNSIGEAIVESNIAQANAQSTTNWLLVALLAVIGAFGFGRFSALRNEKKAQGSREEPSSQGVNGENEVADSLARLGFK